MSYCKTPVRLLIVLLLFNCIRLSAQEYQPIVELSVNTQNLSGPIVAPVRSGIPLPETLKLKDARKLVLLRDSAQVLLASSDVIPVDRNQQQERIPAQFQVLSRWRGTPDDATRPIKWVLLDFQDAFEPGQNATYTLAHSTMPVASSSGLNIVETAEAITVETGKIEVTLNKNNFNFFDRVTVNGMPVLTSSLGNGIVVTDGDGQKYYSALDKPKVVIEENGSEHAVIKVTGGFKNSNGEFLTTPFDSTTHPRLSQPFPYINYTVRFHFYNDQDYVKVLFTFENNGAYGNWPENKYAPKQWLYFEDLSIKLELADFGATRHVASGDFATVLSGQPFSLYQDHQSNANDESQNFAYTIEVQDVVLETGSRSEGWLDVNDVTKGITVAQRYFWQNWPKKVSLQDGRLILGLWPSEGKYPDNVGSNDFEPPNSKPETYQFEGGRHKTYELLFRFYGGAQDLDFVNSMVSSFKKPLFALAPPDWYAFTEALGMIGPDDMHHEDPELDEALQRFDQIQRAKLYLEDGEVYNNQPPTTIYTARENGGGLFYGWMDFGDLWWAEKYCSLHYDWPYSMLLHYLRTGRNRFMEMGEEMARHRYDIDQYHGNREDQGGEHRWNNHLQRYEKGYHGRTGEATPKLTHTWNGGLILYYLLTGDHKARESAKAVYENIYLNMGKFLNGENGGSWEIRFQGWSMLNLLNLYRVEGSNKYLELAQAIGKNSLLYLEQQSGGEGFWMEGGDKDKSKLTFFNYVIEALIYLHFYSDDSEIGALIVRMADWLKDEALFGGYEEDGKYMPFQAATFWERGKAKSGFVIWTWFYADLLAYAYQLTRDVGYLDMARKLFRDSVFWYQLGGNTLVDPMFRTGAGYYSPQYPGTQTKIHGWTGRGHQIYLHTEWLLSQDATSVISTKKELPNELSLTQNYPNPFNGETVIKFSLPRQEKVEITVYNIQGKRVRTLVSRSFEAGTHSVTWDGMDQKGNLGASGVYIYKLTAGKSTRYREMVFLK